MSRYERPCRSMGHKFSRFSSPGVPPPYGKFVRFYVGLHFLNCRDCFISWSTAEIVSSAGFRRTFNCRITYSDATCETRGQDDPVRIELTAAARPGYPGWYHGTSILTRSRVPEYFPMPSTTGCCRATDQLSASASGMPSLWHCTGLLRRTAHA